MKSVLFFVCFVFLFSHLHAIQLVLQDDGHVPSSSLNAWLQQVLNELNALFGSEPDVRVLLKIGKIGSVERRGWMRVDGGLYEIQLNDSGTLYRTLRHEFMHLYLDAWARSKDVDVPLWVHEGLANWFESLKVSGKRVFFSMKGLPVVDPLRYREYPEDTVTLEAYYLYITDFFRTLDKVYGFGGEFVKLLGYFAETGDFARSLEKLKDVDFDSVHSMWLFKMRSLVFLGWLTRWGPWTLSVLLLMVAMCFHLKRRRAVYHEESDGSGSDGIYRETGDRGDFTD